MTTIITALPTPPTQSDPTNFSDRADTFLTALPTFVTETNTLAAELNQIGTNSSSAATTAVAAASAAVSVAGVVKWVSGTTYANGAAVYSPSNYLTYRRITASGSGTIDPSVDTTNWTPVSGTGNVSTDGSGNLAIGVGGVAAARLDVRSAASTPVVKIAGTGTGLLLQANTGALGSENEEFAVDNTGRVFVNTSSTHAASDSYLFVNGNTSLYGSNPAVQFNAYRSSGSIYAKAAGYTAALTFDQSTGTFALVNANASASAGAASTMQQSLTVASTGFVGIGPDALSPSALLTVAKSQADTTSARVSNTNSAASAYSSIKLTTNAGTWDLRTGSTAGNAGSFNLVPASGTVALTATSLGYFGINQTAPVARFEVLENASTPAMRITQTGTGDVIQVFDELADTSIFVVNAAGLVGIGNASPSADLHIKGTAVIEKLEGSASSELRMYGTSGQVKIRNVDGSGLQIDTAITDVGTVTNVARFDSSALTAYKPLVLTNQGDTTNTMTISRASGTDGNALIQNTGGGDLTVDAAHVVLDVDTRVRTKIGGNTVIDTNSAGTTFSHPVTFSGGLNIGQTVLKSVIGGAPSDYNDVSSSPSVGEIRFVVGYLGQVSGEAPSMFMYIFNGSTWWRFVGGDQWGSNAPETGGGGQ